MSNKVKNMKNDDDSDISSSDISDIESDMDGSKDELSDMSLIGEEEEEEVTSESSDEEIEAEMDSSDGEKLDVPINKLFKVRANFEANRPYPTDIKLKYSALDICFHPTENLLASCNCVGECTIFRYETNTTEKISKLKHHKKSCRKIGYSSDGSVLCSISEDKSLAFTDLNTAKPKIHIKDAHESGLTALGEVDENMWATGDEDGTVKLWDVRQQKPSYNFKSTAEETVVDFTIDEHDKYLVAAFENCAILPIRLKNYKPKEETIGFVEHRCTALTVMNENSANTLAVAACDSGKLVFFKYGTFILESFGLIHSIGVNCLLPFSNTKIITGSDDGKIRLAGVSPCKCYGIIGSTNNSPILSLANSNTDDFLASSSADNKIQFWTTKKMENVKPMKYNALNRKKNYRTNEKILKSSRTRSVGQFLRDVRSKVKHKDYDLPAYSRELE